MTVKKIALLGAASVAALGMSVSFAGGPANCMPAADVSGIYVGVDGGAVYDSTMKLDEGTATSTTPVSLGVVTVETFTSKKLKNGPWGWTFGAHVGYQVNNNWGVEVGYIWNQKQKLTGDFGGYIVKGEVITQITKQAATIKFNTYSWYAALRGMLPVFDNFSAYMLVGPAWTHVTQEVTFATATAQNTKVNKNYWTPMGAVGVSWHVADGLAVNLQYMYLVGDLAANKAGHLDGLHDGSQRMTIGVDYLFGM